MKTYTHPTKMFPAMREPFSGKQHSYAHNLKLRDMTVFTVIKIVHLKDNLRSHGFAWQKAQHTDQGTELGGWVMQFTSASSTEAEARVKRVMEAIGAKREHVSVFWVSEK